MGVFLSVTLPLVLLAYAIWLAVRMVRRRARGGACAGGCASCPYADGCRAAKPSKPKGAKRDA
jgi:hypothetical protein